MPKQKLIVILGQTATGKSDLAVRLAKKYNGEIISADSRQVYKGLDIGSGKITKKEMWGVPHYLLSVTNPKEQFSVAEYKALAQKAINFIHSRGKVPILCGGTGFYIDAVLYDTSLPEVGPNKKLRTELEKKSTEKLYAELLTKDFERAQTIDKYNRPRLIRALEIVEALGRVPKLSKKESPYSVLKIGLAFPEPILKKKIKDRLVKRYAGMVREAKRLHTQGLSWKRMEELGLEYRFLARLLQNKIGRVSYPRGKAVEVLGTQHRGYFVDRAWSTRPHRTQLVFSSSRQSRRGIQTLHYNKITKEIFMKELESAIWHYAKRQKTWFKRDKEIVWVEPSKIKKVEREVKKFVGGR